ncbi:GlxA family transcriptional regulator [Streptosporangium sp. NBC_01756]|uniref:GlxA family transcriptional regulator n=1 Tax=Streptosporangium sp. NBC_01756 TaxID=2975950 RepID=UPI002DDBE855|nr:GlxA family transcriptional regulator [Streptosporangium sp. NBC_01756]WSC86302.1 GlxA family transcriptional regulator [Streptosporangium sp. NBC_01756]
MNDAEVLVVVYDGVQLLDVAGPLEAFDGATRVMPGSYRVRLASLDGRDVVTSSGVRLGVETDLAQVEDRLDTLLVAGGWGYADAVGDRELVDQVRRLSAGARRTVSVCTGAFVLAEAGLLDGRRATTHWAYCAALAETYPAVTVEPDAIFVRDAGVGTSAGVTAGLDLALALIEEDHGADLARRVARWLVVFLQRPGGQSQFSMWSRARPPGDEMLRRLLGEIAADPAADHSVAALAERLSVSERHVSRLFTRQVGMTPGRYVERARVETARVLLEIGPDGVESIARRSGFGSSESMRRAFIREIGVPPSAYRDRFTGTTVVL